MPSQRPSIQFYTRDWLSHSGLAGCSLTARGLAIAIICVMHDSPIYGRLLSADGSAMSVDNLARRVGDSPARIKRMLEELLANGVFHRVADGVVESPRMMRDEDRRNRRAANGALGGNPALPRKDRVKDKDMVNHEDNCQPAPSSAVAVASTSAVPDEQHPDSPAAVAAPVLTVIADGKMSPAQRKTWLAPYGDVWKAEMGGEMPCGQAATVFKKLEAGGRTQPEIIANLRRYCLAHQGPRASFASLSKFGETFAQWSQQAAEADASRRNFTIGERAITGHMPGRRARSPAQQETEDRYARLLAGGEA